VPTEFAAILLVCLASVPPERCDENSAVELRSTVVDNELRCTFGWQEMIAREPPSTSKERVYLKTLCRRIKPPTPAGTPARPASERP
jgi:hypothetical protein